MTEQDFAKIKFRIVSHVSMKQQHSCICESINHEPRIALYVRTRINDDGNFGRTITHYIFNGKTYKSKKKFLEAITAFEEGMKSKFEKI